MQWELATDDQLKTIIRYDVDLPTHLLGGLVTEMLNRNLLEGLIKKAIMKQFMSIELATQVLNMPEEDLFQHCRMVIFQVTKVYKSGLSPFIYYALKRLVGRLGDLERRVKAEKRRVYLNIQSIDKELDGGTTLTNVLPSRSNVEKEVIQKITLEEKFQKITKKEKRYFLLYFKGYNTTEIGKMMNVHRSSVAKRINLALTKMSGEETNLKEIGLLVHGRELA